MCYHHVWVRGFVIGLSVKSKLMGRICEISSLCYNRLAHTLKQSVTPSGHCGYGWLQYGLNIKIKNQF